jgi:predicted glycoside hydrolase/deacetylase ChbG (UPF0249 family)
VRVIIVNADDWGRSEAETDAALFCYRQGRITSVSAMVYMKDSNRAADLANDMGIDVGLHLNLTEPFSATLPAGRLVEYHQRVARFLTGHKYAFLLYNLALRREFRFTYQAQVDEFVRLYGRLPSHVDGHHHKHLCTNMLLDAVIPEGEKVRRHFFFWPEEKGRMNRSYRHFVNVLLARRYRLTDFFFALSQCTRNDRLSRVMGLAKTATVELMGHPVNPVDYALLMGDAYLAHLTGLEKGTYSSL